MFACVINWYSVSITLCTTKLFCRAPSLDPWPETCPVFWCFYFLKTSVIKLINTNLSGVQIRVFFFFFFFCVHVFFYYSKQSKITRQWLESQQLPKNQLKNTTKQQVTKLNIHVQGKQVSKNEIKLQRTIS